MILFNIASDFSMNDERKIGKNLERSVGKPNDILSRCLSRGIEKNYGEPLSE
jgi:hypothetical protein